MRSCPWHCTTNAESLDRGAGTREPEQSILDGLSTEPGGFQHVGIRNEMRLIGWLQEVVARQTSRDQSHELAKRLPGTVDGILGSMPDVNGVCETAFNK